MSLDNSKVLDKRKVGAQMSRLYGCTKQRPAGWRKRGRYRRTVQAGRLRSILEAI